MKKIIFTLLTSIMLLLAGCLETTEIDMKDDGTGMVTITYDISSLSNMLKSMPGATDGIDTTYQFAFFEMFMTSFSLPEKEILKTGTVDMKVNYDKDIMIYSFKYPFLKTNEISNLQKLTQRFVFNFFADMTRDEKPRRAATCAVFDGYFNILYSNGLMSKTLIKEKFASAEKDSCIIAMKNGSEMGISVSATRIIHLPRPAKKVEGKNAILSADRKVVTVKADLEDFLKDPQKMEFKIEY